MTETIEQKALALVNEVRTEYPLVSSEVASNLALCRAIEQHEAFRREVSEAVKNYYGDYPRDRMHPTLSRFIIPPHDPLVEVIREMALSDADQRDADRLREALAKRGGKIVWGEG